MKMKNKDEMDGFDIGILVCSIGIATLWLWGRSEYIATHTEEIYKEELYKFFKNIRWYGEDIDCKELAAKYKNLYELKEVNKRISKIINLRKNNRYPKSFISKFKTKKDGIL